MFQAKSKIINRAKCLAISQVIRVKLYNSCLLFVSKIIYLSYYLHSTYYLGPPLHMHSCLAYCLHESQAIVSFISSLIHISISLALSLLLYLL
jgi:hypothetical protein